MDMNLQCTYSATKLCLAIIKQKRIPTVIPTLYSIDSVLLDWSLAPISRALEDFRSSGLRGGVGWSKAISCRHCSNMPLSGLGSSSSSSSSWSSAFASVTFVAAEAMQESQCEAHTFQPWRFGRKVEGWG